MGLGVLACYNQLCFRRKLWPGYCVDNFGNAYQLHRTQKVGTAAPAESIALQ